MTTAVCRAPVGRRPKVALAFRPELQPWLFPPALWRRLEEQGELLTTPFTAANWPAHRTEIVNAEVLVASWGIPVLNREFLDAMPRLRLVLYAAGSVRGFVTDEFWTRDIQISTAVSANAVPTAAFAEAMIILALKHVWFYMRERRTGWPELGDTASSGVHGATVGILGFSRVGRRVIYGLQRHELTILACDPTVSPQEADALGVRLVDLHTLFEQSDVVSVHAPLLPDTTGLIGAELIRRMKAHATLVNTARGALIREGEMIDVLRERRDLTALLDVTDPEPAPADSPLRALPNIIITPHLAGARHRDIERLGAVVLEELSRYFGGEPMHWRVDAASAALMA